MMKEAKYKRRAKNIYSFLRYLNKPLSRVEIFKKFKEHKLIHKGINTNDRALNYLITNKKIIKYFAKSGRIMFKVL